MSEDWSREAERSNPDESGAWTPCWWQGSAGSFCGAATDDPIGLCPRHRDDLVPPQKPRRRDA